MNDAFQELWRNNAIGYASFYSQDIHMNVTQLIFYEEPEQIANRNVELLLKSCELNYFGTHMVHFSALRKMEIPEPSLVLPETWITKYS